MICGQGLKITFLLKGGYMSFHVSLGECIVYNPSRNCIRASGYTLLAKTFARQRARTFAFRPFQQACTSLQEDFLGVDGNFPKSGVSYGGGPCKEDYSILGSIWGLLISGNYHLPAAFLPNPRDSSTLKPRAWSGFENKTYTMKFS